MAEIWNGEPPDHEENVVVDDNGVERTRTRVVRNNSLASRETAARLSQFIYLLFGIVEALIAIRVILKLIAANPANPFANLIYSFTELFLWPFFGLTWTPAAGGMVLEISSIIAILVYMLISWVIVKIVWLLLYRENTSTVETYDEDVR